MLFRSVFLDHFGLESERDLPGVKELRDSGLLDNRPAPGGALGDTAEDDEDLENADQDDMFE